MIVLVTRSNEPLGLFFTWDIKVGSSFDFDGDAFQSWGLADAFFFFEAAAAGGSKDETHDPTKVNPISG